MHEVRVTREIDVPKDVLWAVLDDFGGVAKYNPGVTSSGIVAGPDTGEGATRECVLSEGGRIEEKITSYEPDESYTVEFTEMGDFPLKQNVVNISVAALDDSRSSVTMDATFSPKYGPLGWVMAKMMMKSKFEETFTQTLDGLASYVETGQYEHSETASEAASD